MGWLQTRGTSLRRACRVIGLSTATWRYQRRTSATKVLGKLEATDCVICEHSPQRCDALAVLDEVRERDTDLPFFIITDDDRTVTAALSAGVTDCVSHGRREILAHKIDRAINAY